VHPILADRKRLILYLLAWIPFAALLSSLLAVGGDFTWATAAELGVPLTGIYAVMCLSAWYLCRFIPVGSSRVWYLLLAIVPASAATSLIWAGGIAYVVADLEGLLNQYLPHRPLMFGAGIMLYYAAAGFHYMLMAMQVSREAQDRETEAGMLAREAELRSLKAQINPHFLFNSLHSISALTSSDPAKARQMCILLSDFLRSSLGVGDRVRIPLGEELILARNFLAIQKVRFGARLHVDESLDESADACLLPPLLLQPLVENAVTHGIATLVDGGSILLETERRGDEVTVIVENTFDPDAPRRRRTGVGLPNVRKRLAAVYGADVRFEVSETGGRFRVRLVIPAQTEEKP
jgi:two-component system, LytTR family, sensor histidine kinase AlgZ